ncbi:MAG: hypothetical protein ABWX83_11995 [Luteibacter sp.]
MQLTYRKAALVAGMLVLSSSVLAASTPFLPLALPNAWVPPGWMEVPAKSPGGPDMVEGKAALVRDGRTVGALQLMIVRYGSPLTIAEAMKRMIAGEQQAAQARNAHVDGSPTESDTWRGRPALKTDMSISQAAKAFRQRIVMTQTSDHVICIVTFSSATNDFDPYVGELEAAKRQVKCPG